MSKLIKMGIPHMSYFLYNVFLTIAIVLCHIPIVNAQEVAVLKSFNVKPYDDVFKGFKSVCCNSKVKEFILTEQDSRTPAEIRRMHPDLIFAIGDAALVRVKDLDGIPIVFTMIIDPKAIINEYPNVTGISMTMAPERQIGSLLEILPNAKRIGVVCNPNKSSRLLEGLRNASSKFGVTIISKTAFTPKEAFAAIEGLKGKIDVILMLPDMTVNTQETFESLLLFSFENNIPVISFSKKYVEKGALMALSIEEVDIGAQAGEMAKEILSGTDIRDIPIQTPRKAVMSVNLKTAKKLGINVSEEIIKKSEVIR